ncbi:MAG: hypothetical protein ACK5RA_09390 [Cyanobacteriota bacterium]|jgi:hypothetical protein
MNAIENSLIHLCKMIGSVQIGRKDQFPYGWRNAAKGRTVWRILEELITQNIELHHRDLGFAEIQPAASEVGVYDFQCRVEGDDLPVYINIKSAVVGGRTNKDDISKALKLQEFYADKPDAELFVATMFIRFNSDMTIELTNAAVFPLAWLPDIYVNPSNNGNLQSSKYKDIGSAIPRSNQEFRELLALEIEEARRKKNKS